LSQRFFFAKDQAIHKNPIRAIALTLKPEIGYVLFGLGFVAHFIISHGIQQRKNKAPGTNPRAL